MKLLSSLCAKSIIIGVGGGGTYIYLQKYVAIYLYNLKILIKKDEDNSADIICGNRYAI